MVAVRRAVVIFVAQILVLIFIVVATMAGALAGDTWLANAAPISIAGFFISVLLTALFFLLVEITHNTRNPFSP